jgi:hypothetical protein
MTPYISLKIQNYTPSLYYHPTENESRKMTQTDENLGLIIWNIARELKLLNSESYSNAEVDELISLARESDETFLEIFPEMEFDTSEFGLQNVADNAVKKSLESKEDPYSEVEMHQSVRKELNSFQNADIFASILETLYAALIAKTLLTASELGLGTVKLEDEHKNPRLMEKMGRELDSAGVEFMNSPKEENSDSDLETQD